MISAEDRGRFPVYIDLYLNMQLTYDALRIIVFDMELMAAMGEMNFMRELAHARKIAQGRFIACRKS